MKHDETLRTTDRVIATVDLFDISWFGPMFVHHYGSRTRESRKNWGSVQFYLGFPFEHPIRLCYKGIKEDTWIFFSHIQFDMQLLHISSQEPFECHDVQTGSVDTLGQSPTPRRSTWSWRFCACKWPCWKSQRRRCGHWQSESWDVRLKLIEFPVVVLNHTWGCLQMLELILSKWMLQKNTSLYTKTNIMISHHFSGLSFGESPLFEARMLHLLAYLPAGRGCKSWLPSSDGPWKSFRFV